MRRVPLTFLLLALAVAPAFAKENAKEERARLEVQRVMARYLDARFRGAPWKEFSDAVLWTAEQEPACQQVARSFEPGPVRFAERDRALASVTFYQLGTYCPAEQTFRPAPRLDNAVFQLRKRSIVWLVEKTNRPGGQLDWKVLRDRLKQQLAGPALPTAETARIANALSVLEKTASAIGRTGN
ncbi:MAG: hypothetical protein HYX28_06140 [Candidatus Koribacter versatilis]|uniref:Secreted protein n=1 Tax=Candidatus Korobacter versatilis TaxID=658062 RepID=A0A932EPK3_9BACT|nr:hypothetical protein [Candidatus Koribacter versatilis]